MTLPAPDIGVVGNVSVAVSIGALAAHSVLSAPSISRGGPISVAVSVVAARSVLPPPHILGGFPAYVFTPPEVLINPPYMPSTPYGPARSLFRHYTPRAAGTNVYLLSDGTYVQTYATPENSNTNIPYPWDPYYLPPPPISRVFDIYGHETELISTPTS